MSTNRYSRTRRRGQGLVEYGAVVALIAVLAIGSLGILGAATTGVFNDFTAAVNSVTTGNTTTSEGDNPTEGQNPDQTPSDLSAAPAFAVISETAGGFGGTSPNGTPGAFVSFNANIAGGDGIVYGGWFIAGNPIYGLSNDSWFVPCSLINLVPAWSLNLSDDTGVSLAFSGTIPPVAVCAPAPMPSFNMPTASPTLSSVAATVDFYGTPRPGVTVSFAANASGGTGNLSYHWSFVGNVSSNLASGTVDLACIPMNMNPSPAKLWFLDVTGSDGAIATYSGTLPDASAICGG